MIPSPPCSRSSTKSSNMPASERPGVSIEAMPYLKRPGSEPAETEAARTEGPGDRSLASSIAVTGVPGVAMVGWRLCSRFRGVLWYSPRLESTSMQSSLPSIRHRLHGNAAAASHLIFRFAQRRHALAARCRGAELILPSVLLQSGLTFIHRVPDVASAA